MQYYFAQPPCQVGHCCGDSARCKRASRREGRFHCATHAATSNRPVSPSHSFGPKSSLQRMSYTRVAEGQRRDSPQMAAAKCMPPCCPDACPPPPRPPPFMAAHLYCIHALRCNGQVERRAALRVHNPRADFAARRVDRDLPRGPGGGKQLRQARCVAGCRVFKDPARQHGRGGGTGSEAETGCVRVALSLRWMAGSGRGPRVAGRMLGLPPAAASCTPCSSRSRAHGRRSPHLASGPPSSARTASSSAISYGWRPIMSTASGSASPSSRAWQAARGSRFAEAAKCSGVWPLRRRRGGRQQWSGGPCRALAGEGGWGPLGTHSRAQPPRCQVII